MTRGLPGAAPWPRGAPCPKPAEGGRELGARASSARAARAAASLGDGGRVPAVPAVLPDTEVLAVPVVLLRLLLREEAPPRTLLEGEDR